MTQRAQTGAPVTIPAMLWNDLISMADEWRAGATSKAKVSGLPVAPSCSVWVKNESGADAGYGSVIKITESLLDAERNIRANNTKPILSGVAATGPYDFVGVYLDDVPANVVGRAAIMGVCVARVAVSKSGDGYASPSAGSQKLLSDDRFGPIRILATDADDTEDEQYLPVFLNWLPPTEKLNVVTNIVCGTDGKMVATTQSVRVFAP